jgi:tRNA modification GTPase
MDEPGTIAAVATAPGRGGVAVVRVSGLDAFSIAASVAGREPEPGRISFTSFRAADGTLVDRGVLLAFAAPHSYTGEDIVEFQCHGGAVTPRRVLDACFAAGARLARKGEFTQRAFLNGRIDLSEAEGVIELVDAKTDRAADDALSRLGGERARAYRTLYERALEASSTLEHALDVDEGDLPDGFTANVAADLARLRGDVESALAKARGGHLLREGALVVLAGPPNAGKSSLMNALLGTGRAIVSATPGTTRDSIEESLDIGGWPVRLVDTAGLREAADDIEAEGVSRAEDLIARADLVVRLASADGSQPPANSAAEILVSSKCDLARGPWLNVSAVTGEGLDALRAEIAARLESMSGGAADSAATPSERERSLLAEASRALAVPGEDPVLMANAARSAASALGRIVGAEYSSDLLDALFSRFCVGK